MDIILHVKLISLLQSAVLVSLLTSCAPPATPVPVTLTAPAPTATAIPVELMPPLEVGANLVYADGTTLVAIPHGTFAMGHGTAENPQHDVILSDYWLYATEVTNSQYSLCVAQGWCTAPDVVDNPQYGSFETLNRPVVGVTHDQASTYCRFVNAELPTEAQWEKAARGVDGRRYPWGDTEPTCKLANSNNCTKMTADVTANLAGASPYGALGMSGNVFEWVADWYDPLYYESSPPGDPQGPVAGNARVIRSSAYRSSADQSLTYARSYSSPNDHRIDLGFRCAVTDPSRFAPACQLTPVVAAAQMAGVESDCPKLSIDVQVTACRYGGGAVVTFNDDHPRDANASFGGIVGCTLISGQPGSYPLSYACRRASTAVMSSSCTYSQVPQADCPARYAVDPKTGMCVWSGAQAVGIDCPPGEFYDPALHCCRVATGLVTDFAVCPVGSIFTEIAADRYVCLPADSARSAPQAQEDINPPVCENVCELTSELCALRNLVFCPTTCSCLAVGRKCPEP